MATRSISNSPRVSTRETFAHAAKCLSETLRGVALELVLNTSRSRPDRARVFNICFGVCRYFFSLKWSLERVIKRDFNSLDDPVKCLLFVGAAQLRLSQMKRHAVVSEAVEACVLLGFNSAKGLVNAALRRVSADNINPSREAQYDSPGWLIDALQNEYASNWPELLRINNTRAPTTVRVTKQQTDTITYQETLAAAHIRSHTGPYRETITFDEAMPVDRIPGYQQGLCSVQDAHSQIAVKLLKLKENVRVLDACAAPGTKTLQILDQHPSVSLHSIDTNRQRTKWFTRETKRLSLSHEIQIADATSSEWWDGDSFERILVDAPCSGTGTLRRHPDIKVHRNIHDITTAHALQVNLLRNLWDMLSPKGLLLYCTCSLLSKENDQTIAAFLSSSSDCSVQPLRVPDAISQQHGVQLLPKEGGGDGFYFSLLQKQKVAH